MVTILCKKHVSVVYMGEMVMSDMVDIYMYTSFSYNDDNKNCTLLSDEAQYGNIKQKLIVGSNRLIS